MIGCVGVGAGVGMDSGVSDELRSDGCGCVCVGCICVGGGCVCICVCGCDAVIAGGVDRCWDVGSGGVCADLGVDLLLPP